MRPIHVEASARRIFPSPRHEYARLLRPGTAALRERIPDFGTAPNRSWRAGRQRSSLPCRPKIPIGIGVCLVACDRKPSVGQEPLQVSNVALLVVEIVILHSDLLDLLQVSRGGGVKYFV